MNKTVKIGFGGGCHWCTEAVFQSLKGVESVAQGWIASKGETRAFSEAVIVTFNPEIIPLSVLTKIHLNTHKSTSNHSMPKKYRSAVYYFSEDQKELIKKNLEEFQSVFENTIITQVLPYKSFKSSGENIIDYYYKNPNKPFCKTFINPKLKLLLSDFKKHTNTNILNHLN